MGLKFSKKTIAQQKLEFKAKINRVDPEWISRE